MFGNRSMMNRAGLCVMSSQHALRAGFFHLTVNRAGHDVARRQRLHRMRPVHEFPAVQRFQTAALAAHRFRNQKRFRLRMIQARRVKLHEFHVRDARARAKRHRHAVARWRCRDSSCRDKPCRSRPSPESSPARKTSRPGWISCRKRKRQGSGSRRRNPASGS